MQLQYLVSWAANALIVGSFAITFGWVLTEAGFAMLAKRANHLQNVSVGNALARQGIPTDASLGTLVLVLDTMCPYCSEGAPTYRKALAIQSPLTNKPLRSIAVCPQRVETCSAYLRSHALPVDVVLSHQLSTINVSGTLALFLLNHDGVVIASWLGLPDQSVEMSLKRRIQDLKRHKDSESPHASNLVEGI